MNRISIETILDPTANFSIDNKEVGIHEVTSFIVKARNRGLGDLQIALVVKMNGKKLSSLLKAA